jgi:hypothetical protein
MNTTGLVQSFTLVGNGLCISLGPAGGAGEFFSITISDSDSDAIKISKRLMIFLIGRAYTSGFLLTITHDAGSAVITNVSNAATNICPLGPAITNDFYTVSGSNIPAGVQLVFTSGIGTVTVTPQVIRPQFVFVSELPPAVPLGRNMLHLQAGGWSSDAVPIDVTNDPPLVRRVLYSGGLRDKPYTIVFVANPAIIDANGITTADPVLTNRSGFHDTVRYCLKCLLTLNESFLYSGNRDAGIRFVTIFDPSRTPGSSTTLVKGDAPNICEPIRNAIGAFVTNYTEDADIVYAVTGSTTYDRASAWFTTDDAGKGNAGFTYGGVARHNGLFASTPGTIALPLDADQTGPTPLHELGHAASDFDNGRVIDLYVDGGSGPFNINKKFRAKSTDAVPANFDSYNGTTYKSDINRDHLGYPADWVSYQALLADDARPNLMDNYWFASDDPLKCRLDGLTLQYFLDRIGAKLAR